MGRLRDFGSINAYLSDREIDELQAAIDERRQARVRQRADPEAEEFRPPATAETNARLMFPGP